MLQAGVWKRILQKTVGFERDSFLFACLHLPVQAGQAGGFFF
jgi:hypothetical protein